MSTLQLLTIILHVLFGLGAVILSYGVWMMLLKRAPHTLRAAKTAWWAFAFAITSWVTGGYYYVSYYGTAVKPVIKAGEFPWAHTIITETKEHIFCSFRYSRSLWPWYCGWSENALQLTRHSKSHWSCLSALPCSSALQ